MPGAQDTHTEPAAPAAGAQPALNCRELFWLFTRISMVGFGGVLPFLYRELVERRRLLDVAEFRELFALGQVLPGPSICNVSVMVGWRHAGVAGGASALAGIMLGPMVLVILLGLGYTHYGGGSARLASMLAGMSAVAAGLIVVMGLRMAASLPRRWSSALLALLALLGISALHQPLWLVLGVLAPAGMLLLGARRDANGASRQEAS